MQGGRSRGAGELVSWGALTARPAPLLPCSPASCSPATKDGREILPRLRRYVCRTFATNLGYGLDDFGDERRFVAFPAMGHGGEVRGIGFDEKPIGWHHPGDFA